LTLASKVRLGFLSFTEITDPARHRAYNEWHQLDHMPEQFPLDGVAYGRRWVSTPACRAARAVSGERLDPIHYLTCYLMTEPVTRTLEEFKALAVELRDAGRWFEERRAVLSGPFPLIDGAAAPRVRVSAAAVPWRPERGVYAVVAPADDPGPGCDEWCAVPGVAGAWVFADERRAVTLAWCDDDPLAVASRVGSLVPARAELAGPFATVMPGEWDWFD
jgi:hypothetical protein